MSAQEGFAEPDGEDKGRLAAGAEAAPGAVPRLRLAYLDGLRALAAGYVVLFHAVPGFHSADLVGGWRLLRRALAFGHEAVAIFIVLSGYCLMLPLVRKRPERYAVDLGDFMRRRAWRILPPYFAALTLSVLALACVPVLRTTSGTIWDDSLPGLDAGALVSHLLVVHNWAPTWAYRINGPLWSVATEWQIYFFFPLLLLPAWRRWGMLATLLLAALVGYAPLLLVPASARVAIPWYLLLFALGMCGAGIGFSGQAHAGRLRSGVPWGALALGLWLLCGFLSFAMTTFWFAHKPVADLSVGFATFALLVHLTERASGSTPGPVLALLQSRALVEVGHFSYSLYLTHLPVLALCYFGLKELAWSGPTRALALAGGGGLASLALAYAFHVLIERRFIVRR
jgi:peptidoglycan/LPS O-acetylase OafA/YrhL